MKKIVHICLALFILMACNHSIPEYDSKIVTAYSLVRTDTDSAFKLLRGMNINDFSSPHDRAYYAYTYTATLYWLNVHAKSDSLIKVAVDYYSIHGDSAMKAKTFYYAAKVYESIKDRQQAISYFNKALKATPADSANLKLFIYAGWAFMINKDRPDSESYELYEKVKEYALKIDSEYHSKYHYVDALIQQGWINLVNKEYSNAIVKYKEADDLIVKYKMDYLRFAPLNRLACCYMEEGNYERAMYYAKEAEKYAKSVTNKRYINETFACIYIKTGKFDKAINCIKLSTDTSNNQKYYIYYKHLWDLYKAKGDYKTACEYGEKHMKYRDLYFIEHLKNNAAESQAKYNNAELELHKVKLELKSKQLKMLLIISVLAVVVLVVVLILVIYMRKVKTMAILKAKDDMMAEMSTTLQLRINELQELRTQLAENSDELEETRRQRQELKLRIFEMNEVVRKINEFKKMKNSDVVGRNHVLVDEELKILSEMTDFLHNGIITKLRTMHPKLTKDDLHLCCLLSLGLSGTKIALMLNTSDDALKKRKSRLVHGKLDVADSNETLEEYLNRLKCE